MFCNNPPEAVAALEEFKAIRGEDASVSREYQEGTRKFDEGWETWVRDIHRRYQAWRDRNGWLGEVVPDVAAARCFVNNILRIDVEELIESIRQMQRGEGVPWEEVRAELLAEAR